MAVESNELKQFNFDPATDNTYSLGNTSYRWKSINVGPGSYNITSTTGTSGTGANYTLGQTTFASGASLSFGTYNIGTGSKGSLEFKTASTSRMFISSTGNIGVGTTSPTAKLSIFSATATASFDIESAGSAEKRFTFLVSTTASAGFSDQLQIRNSANTTLVPIASSGNVGIGTTSGLASYKLNVNGTINASGMTINVLRSAPVEANGQLLVQQLIILPATSASARLHQQLYSIFLVQVLRLL